MAKVKAPLFSLDAAGSLDKSITYRNKPRNKTVSKYAKPGDINPFESSPRQKDQRSIIGLITIAWQCKTSIDKLAWDALAKEARFKGTGYHYFLHLAKSDLKTYLGLVGYWSMNYNIGDKIPDLSGNDNPGTLSPVYPCDSPVLVDSFNKKHGKALYFDGINDFVTLGNPPILDITGPITLELWFNPKGSLTARQGLLSKHQFAVGGYSFVLINNTVIFIYNITGSQKLLIIPGTPISSVNTFYHVSVTLDGVTGKIYLNGILQREEPHTTPDTTSIDLFIGSEPPGGVNCFKGIIDDVPIYNIPLSPEVIRKHYSLLR